MSLTDYQRTRHEAYPDLRAVEREVFPDWRLLCRESRIEIAPYEAAPETPLRELAKRLVARRKRWY